MLLISVALALDPGFLLTPGDRIPLKKAEAAVSSADGRLLVVADQTVFVFGPDNARLFKARVPGLASFTIGGSRHAVLDDRGTLQLFDADGPGCTAAIGTAEDIVLSRDGKLLAAASSGLPIYDAATCAPVRQLDSYGASVWFLRDGRLLTHTGSQTQLWDITTGTLQHALPGGYGARGDVPSGTNQLWTLNDVAGDVAVFDLDTNQRVESGLPPSTTDAGGVAPGRPHVLVGQLVYTVPVRDEGTLIATDYSDALWAEDGTGPVFVHDGRFWMLAGDGQAVTVDLQSGRVRTSRAGSPHGTRLASGAWAVRSADGSEVAIGGRPGRGVRIPIDASSTDLVASGDVLWTIDDDWRLARRDGDGWARSFEPRSSPTLAPGPDGGVFVAAFSEHLAYAGPKGKKRWEVEIPGPHVTVTWGVGQVWAGGGRVTRIDPKDGTELFWLVLPAPGFAGPMALSPDGRTLAVAQTSEKGDRVFLVDVAGVEAAAQSARRSPTGR